MGINKSIDNDDSPLMISMLGWVLSALMMVMALTLGTMWAYAGWVVATLSMACAGYCIGRMSTTW